MPNFHVIAALGKDRGIGYGGQLLWRIPEDLKRFKQLTTGHVVVMGRKTYESIGKPLPNRTNIVITGNRSYSPTLGVLIASDLGEALTQSWAMHGGEKQTFVIGGARVYEEAISKDLVDTLHLTLIDAIKPADTFFPPYKALFSTIVHDESHEWEGLKYRFVDLKK